MTDSDSPQIAPQTASQPTHQTDSSPITRVLLVRHGQSLANAGGIPADHITNPLTELGHEQAKSFAESFPSEPTLFLVSPFVRARQTSVPLVRRFPAIPVEEWPIHEFHYLAPERHNGTSEEQQVPHMDTYWQRGDPTYFDGPGAESFTAFMGRTRDAMKRLARLNTGGCIVMFTHGFVMQAFRLLSLFPAATDHQLMSNFRRFHFVNFIDNTASIEFEVVNGRLRMVGQQHLNDFMLQGETSHV
jgi:2,3-bisphosphoglycerate-dependent phosphoglycerate mutase